MILILSEDHDQSTNDIIDWLIFYKKEFVRINLSDKCEIIKVNNTTINFTDNH
ncbi:MAG: hypothetical protein LBV69_08305 [Bacteroidales bacterium]|jgi:competence protein ComGF|nr:hypothetical protein [Bacteroidales bacterium]